MITEDYVSLETAKLLNIKGYKGEFHKHYWGYESGKEFLTEGSFNSEYDYQAPTLQIVIKWLEENYGIFCVIRRHGNKDDGFTYSWNCEGKMGLSVGNSGGFKTAAEAREAVIKYCLENLI